MKITDRDMDEVKKYVDGLWRSFGIEGVLTFAWYSLTNHRVMFEERCLRPPHLILCGPPGSGKTELANAIAAVDVPEGLNYRMAFHELPCMSVEDIRILIGGAACFSILEGLSIDTPSDVVYSLRHVAMFSPQFLITCLSPSGWQQLYDSFIVVDMPKRSFSDADRQSLQVLKDLEKKAHYLRRHLYSEPANFDVLFERQKEKMMDYIREETTFETDYFCNTIVGYYALIIGHWQSIPFTEEDELEELTEYALKCIVGRLSFNEERKKTKTLMRKFVGTDGKVTLACFFPDGRRQYLEFDDDLMYKGFVHMLRMMESTGAVSVEVSV